MNKKEVLINGIIKENPVLVMTLGLCPVLAITTKVENAIGMGICFIFVLLMSNLFISIFRNIIPSDIRIPIYILIISSFVTIVEMLMAAFLPVLNNNLGIFISLIVVNCIVLGRAESFASKNNVVYSLVDGLAVGFGYFIVLVLVSLIREFLSFGSITLWDGVSFKIKSEIFTKYFSTPSGAYIVLGLLFAVITLTKNKKVKR